MLCLGSRIPEYPQSVQSWTDKVEWFAHSAPQRELDRIDGEPVVFEWRIFPRHTTLELSREVQNMMEREFNVLPKDFKDRVIFVPYNDIGSNQKDSEEICKRNSSSVAECARDFPRGHWSFLGPGSEEKG